MACRGLTVGVLVGLRGGPDIFHEGEHLLASCALGGGAYRIEQMSDVDSGVLAATMKNVSAIALAICDGISERGGHRGITPRLRFLPPQYGK